MNREEQIKKWLEGTLSTKIVGIIRAAPSKRVVVRLGRQEARTKQELEADMDCLLFLNANGVQVAKPLDAGMACSVNSFMLL